MEADSENSSLYSEYFHKRYKNIKYITEGSYGRLYLYEDNVTGEKVAFKEMSFKDMTHFKGKGVPPIIVREVCLLKELQHENIVRVLDVVSNEESVGLVLEYGGKHLDDYRWEGKRGGIVDARTLKSFLHQILDGVAYCHSMNIIHRDLRPDNVLIDEEKQLVKIADFGLAKAIGVPMEAYTEGSDHMSYHAPEILHDNHKYSFPVDVWAVGCMFAVMAHSGLYLFPEIKQRNEYLGELYQLNSIFSVLGTPSNIEDWPRWKKFCQVKGLALERNPEDLSQKFSNLDKAGVDLLSKMLCIDPTKRITAYEALKHEYFANLNN